MSQPRGRTTTAHRRNGVVRQMPHGICDYSINSRYLKPKRAAKQGPVANSQEAIPLVGQGAYDAYKDKARDVAALFTEATGIPVREPSLDPRMS